MDRGWHNSEDYGHYEVMSSDGHHGGHEMCHHHHHSMVNECDQYQSHLGMFNPNHFHDQDLKNDFIEDCENFNYPGMMMQNYFQEAADINIMDDQAMTITSTTRRRYIIFTPFCFSNLWYALQNQS